MINVEMSFLFNVTFLCGWNDRISIDIHRRQARQKSHFVDVVMDCKMTLINRSIMSISHNALTQNSFCHSWLAIWWPHFNKSQPLIRGWHLSWCAEAGAHLQKCTFSIVQWACVFRRSRLLDIILLITFCSLAIIDIHCSDQNQSKQASKCQWLPTSRQPEGNK